MDGVGVGLKPEHYRIILEERPVLDFFEVHAENYMGDGGPPHRYLESICARYALSVHGVGLSIGGAQPLNEAHLLRLKRLIDRYHPAQFSEHLAWSGHGDACFNDLLPLPYNEETLARVCTHVTQVQEVLGRRMLLENPSTYVRFRQSTMTEPEFIGEVCARTGCGLLLDVNNVYVSATNHGVDAWEWLKALPLEAVGEVHLAGFARSRDDSGHPLLIDHHGSPVDEKVWALYARALLLLGAPPTLVEWDSDVPAWSILYAEAQQARKLLEAHVAGEEEGSDAARAA